MKIIRSVIQDMTSRDGFVWPACGHVKANDWEPTKKCGHGLHGLKLNQNDPGTWYDDGKFLVLEVDENCIVDLGNKCKFPEAEVLKTFDSMSELTTYLYDLGENIEGMYRRTQISDKSVNWIGGDYSVLTGGEFSTLVGGYYSILTGGYKSILAGGKYSILTGEDRSTLTGGYDSRLTGGNCSTLTGGDESILTGGDNSKLTGGDNSKLIGGKYNTLTGGDYSTLIGGNCSKLTGGDFCTLTGGDESILTGGDNSTLINKWWDGHKYRISTAYVGEDGILPNTPYLNYNGNFVVVK